MTRVATLDDVADDHPDFALAVRAGARLRRLAPAAIEQRDGGGHARRLVLAVLRDAGERAERHLGVAPRQRTDIGRRSSHLTGGCPLLLAQASNPHPRPARATTTRII